MGLDLPTCNYTPADIELQGQAWYHSRISQETAEERLNKVPYHCFLIRENDAKGSNLSLAMKHQGKISHFLIEKVISGYELTETHMKFDTLLQLVDFYMNNSISGDPHHHLSSPCPQPFPDGECNKEHDASIWRQYTLNPTPSLWFVYKSGASWGGLGPLITYCRIGLSGAHPLFSTHRLLSACCLFDKIFLDPR